MGGGGQRGELERTGDPETAAERGPWPWPSTKMGEDDLRWLGCERGKEAVGRRGWGRSGQSLLAGRGRGPRVHVGRGCPPLSLAQAWVRTSPRESGQRLLAPARPGLPRPLLRPPSTTIDIYPRPSSDGSRTLRPDPSEPLPEGARRIDARRRPGRTALWAVVRLGGQIYRSCLLQGRPLVRGISLHALLLILWIY